MENYLEKLKNVKFDIMSDINTINMCIEIMSIYKTLGEDTPLFPFLNCAAMVALQGRLPEECKNITRECIRDNMWCVWSNSGDSVFCDDMYVLHFRDERVNTIPFNLTSNGSFMAMRHTSCESDVSYLFTPSSVYRLLHGVYYLLSRKFFNTVTIMEENMEKLPSRAKVVRGLKETFSSKDMSEFSFSDCNAVWDYMKDFSYTYAANSGGQPKSEEPSIIVHKEAGNDDYVVTGKSYLKVTKILPKISASPVYNEGLSKVLPSSDVYAETTERMKCLVEIIRLQKLHIQNLISRQYNGKETAAAAKKAVARLSEMTQKVYNTTLHVS